MGKILRLGIIHVIVVHIVILKSWEFGSGLVHHIAGADSGRRHELVRKRIGKHLDFRRLWLVGGGMKGSSIVNDVCIAKRPGMHIMNASIGMRARTQRIIVLAGKIIILDFEGGQICISNGSISGLRELVHIPQGLRERYSVSVALDLRRHCVRFDRTTITIDRTNVSTVSFRHGKQDKCAIQFHSPGNPWR